MTINYLLMFFLLVAGLISGCGRSGGNGNSTGKDGPDKALMDSLKKLDSAANENEVANPVRVREISEKAMEIAKRSSSGEAMARAYLIMGMSCYNQENDSAMRCFATGLKIADSIGCDNLKAAFMYKLALLYQEAGDLKTALLYLDSVATISSTSMNYYLLSNAYIAKGTIKISLGDTNSCIRMYDSALSVSRKHQLPIQIAVALANLSQFKKDQAESIRLKKEAVQILAGKSGNEEEQAGILVNIGMQLGNTDSSVAYNLRAIQVAGNLPLSPAIIIANNNLAYDYMDRKEFNKAEDCLIVNAIPMAEKAGNYDWISSLNDTRADLCIARGQFKEAFEAERSALKFRNLSARLQATKQTRLLSAMLDLRNNEIRLQAKEKEILKKEDRIRWIILWFSMAILLMFAGILLIQWRLQKNKIRYQTQMLSSANKIIEAEENEKARLGRDFHDITGQKFTSLSAYLETLDFPDREKKERALEMLGEIGASVRKMSQRMNRTWLERFSLEDSLSGLCNDFIRLTGLDLEFHQPSAYPIMPREASIHLFRIVQELLTNSVKHAQGSKVNLSISAEGTNLVVKYSDNGPGFDQKSATGKGMGLNNLSERVTLLNGSIETDSREGFGTFYQITIPVAPRRSFIDNLSGKA